MRVFVAGATGAVGRQLLPQLVAGGHHVVAITRSPGKIAALQEAGAEAVLCDVFDFDRLAPIVAGAKLDAIINQLTDLPRTMKPRQLARIYARNNHARREGTRTLLHAARAASVPRFITQSVAFWYKPQGGAIKSESEPLWLDAPEPIGVSVRVIAEMESAVLAAAPIGIVLRYGHFYGPATWYARDGQIGKRTRGRQYPILGDGSAVTSFIHVEDAASAAVAALEAPSSAIYNVVDDEPAAQSVWLPAYAKAIGGPRPRRLPVWMGRLVLGKALTTWITSMRGASNHRIRTELGWMPRYPQWRAGFIRTTDGLINYLFRVFGGDGTVPPDVLKACHRLMRAIDRDDRAAIRLCMLEIEDLIPRKRR